MTAIPTLIDRYEIVAKIGEGSIAEVFKAHDPKTGRMVAIKLLKDHRAIAEFIHETRMIGRLSHHNIVTIYDVGEFEGKPYFAMEYLDGHFLDTELASGNRFRWPQVVNIAKQLASALDYAHNQGLTHGDIKPGNILWDSSANKVVLTDFGNAKQVNIYDTDTLKVSKVNPSAPYMSPEHIKGQTVDQRSDLFSLGTVLYQLLTGEKPFDSDDFAQLTTQITQRAHKAISISVTQVPEQLIKIVDRLLYKNPDERIQTAADLLEELNGLPMETQLPSALSGKRSFAIASGFVAVVSGVVMAWAWFQEPPVAPGNPPLQAEANAAAKPETTAEPMAREKPLQEAQQESNLQANINQSLAKFECASLRAELTSTKEVHIRGHVSMEEDVIALMDLLDGFPGVNNVTYEVTSLKWPFCEAVAILSPDLHANVGPQRGLDLNNVRHAQTDSRQAAFEVTAPDFDAFLYIDHYLSDGNVRHLQPDAKQVVALTRAGTKFLLEETVTGKISGDSLVVVMATYTPIMGQRPSLEPAQKYLAELHRQVVVNKIEIAADYLVLETVPAAEI